MIIYNVSKIDPILVPILRSDFIIEGNLKFHNIYNIYVYQRIHLL